MSRSSTSTSSGQTTRCAATALPRLPYVYLAEMGCKKVAASNVESVFSGAGNFTEEAKLTGPVLLQRIVKLHYNFKYSHTRALRKQES